MSNLAPSPEVEPCPPEGGVACDVQVVRSRPLDLLGLPIRRILPQRARRLVGPWCFLDAYGPLTFREGKPMDVAPHPHTGLQTVSWLLAGEVLHNDSLGERAVARPGAVNVMTAGRGIAHAEESPAAASGRLHGVQLWVALPSADRDTAPAFEHRDALPTLRVPGARATVFLGALAGTQSPARAFSPIVGADLDAEPSAGVTIPLDPAHEHALLTLAGTGELGGHVLERDTLYYLGTGREQVSFLSGSDPLRALLLGGAPFGETILMWWNFVARTSEEIAEARADWEAGRRFGEVRSYAGPRIEAPPLVARPVRP
jgi:hypothetical protein